MLISAHTTVRWYKWTTYSFHVFRVLSPPHPLTTRKLLVAASWRLVNTDRRWARAERTLRRRTAERKGWVDWSSPVVEKPLILPGVLVVPAVEGRPAGRVTTPARVVIVNQQVVVRALVICMLERRVGVASAGRALIVEGRVSVNRVVGLIDPCLAVGRAASVSLGQV
jgi:hypothetical protein